MIHRKFGGRLLVLVGVVSFSIPASAKKKAAAPKEKVQVASEQTVRAVGDLAGKFKWGMSPEDVTKIVVDDLAAKYDEKIKKETSAFKQDAVRQELALQIAKFKDSYVKFEGQKTGWDVSIIDREFAHKNNESMMVIWEKDQRRFLFFFEGKLWKQFIAFNAENPVFAGKTFDDFAEIIQRRYGPAAMTFKKMRTSDEQQLDHLEWPPAGDYVLWAIDLTSFYGNFCLSLMQKSALPMVERGRKENSPQRQNSNALVDSVLNSDAKARKVDENADIVDEITGHPAGEGESPAAAPSPSGGKKKGKGKGDADKAEPSTPATSDPLEGTGF